MRAKPASALVAVVLALVWLAPLATAQEGGAIAMTDIRQESSEGSTRLLVECTGPVAYTYYSPDPLTLVVDIPEVDASRMPSRINVGTREVESLRVTSLARGDGRGIARLEVRLASLVPFQIYSRDRFLHLVFERPGAAVAAAPVVEAAPAPEPVSQPAEPELVAESLAPEPAPTEPAVILAPRTQAPPEPEPEPTGPPATRIVAVSSAEGEGRLTLTVQADGRLDYQDFFLGNPDRLVLDFPGVTSRVGRRAFEVNEGPVQRVRVAQFSAANPKVARVVLDLSERAPYRIVEASDGLRVVFGGGGETPSPAPLAALRQPEPSLPAPGPAPQPALPAVLEPQPLVPEPQQPSAQTVTIEQPAPDATYTGAPINLDFKDGDLVDIFRLFADISGLNFVINPGVAGKVSLKLTEVPWDQALDLILKTNGLGRVTEGNVVRIARLTDLQKEENDRRKLAEEKALAGDLQVWRKTLSYAKAGQLQATVQKVALSARGNITLDERTNTMIVTDLPEFINKARDLIAELDRATPQVEIESRIVVTTRNFTRDIGVQWGFTQQQTQAFGNTTNQEFPHSILINGNSVPSQQGIPADQDGLAVPETGFGATGRGYAVNLPAAGFSSGIGLARGPRRGPRPHDAALTALERQGRGWILSSPKVTTQNNQRATIKQGQQIPIQTVANNTVTVQFRDATLTLEVTPQITDAGTVLLQVKVENNSPDFSRAVNGIPPINTQAAETNVLVNDGATSVIGGIFQSQEQTSVNSVPLFSKIPVLGWLFKNKRTSQDNAELLIFITPRILKQGV